MEPIKIMNQAEVQQFLLSRGGNKKVGVDNWEGFTDFASTTPTLTNITPTPTNTTLTPNPTPQHKQGTPKYEQEPKFYNGDQILKGDYFKGWNDTYFFQSSVFRENNNFWNSPFKNTF
jgi:hypothetical protein